jgi:HD-GYP domain-containing protein (c-di-GMP phosphodiesterase class II)
MNGGMGVDIRMRCAAGIPLAARILRVADSYAAITDARPYRPAMNQEKARLHMAGWAGIEFRSAGC